MTTSKARPTMAHPPMAASLSLVLWMLLVISSLPHESLTQESAGPEVKPIEEAAAPPPPPPKAVAATNSNSGSERVTVIGPRNLRPNSDYHVLVSLADSQQPATIDLQLTGARDSDREQIESKSILANSGETQTVKFSIGDWPAAEYILSVTAQAVDRSWNFTQEKTLIYQSKAYSTFIQTDKAIYKPGQLVQFRAIFLTRALGPHLIRDNSINVTVLNPRRSIVKQWSGLSNYRGLLSLDFQLSEDPMLGDGWLIKVASKQGEVSKQFTVAEYILPTFDVSVQLPPYASQNESAIVATVKATYTYGKPVRGHVALTVQPLVRFYQLETRPLEQAQYRARLDEAGSADFSVDIMRDLKLERDPFEREIEFFALVEEDLTGRKYNKTGSLRLHERSIKVELLDGDDLVFKPGMGRQVQLKVAYQDDTPVEDNGPPIELRYSVPGQKPLESVKLQPVGGIVEHTFDIPSKVMVPGYDGREAEQSAKEMTPHYVELTAQYRGQTYHVSTLRARRSESHQFMQVSVPQLQRAAAARIARRRNKQTGKYSRPTATVDEAIKIRISATEPMQQINCHGLAGGNIIWALSPDAKNKSQFEFEVKIDQRMAPELRVLCFYVRPENREIIADSLVIPVDGLVRNSVKISASRDEAKPGQEVEIGVQTKPNALIGLLAIDQSVLLLKSGNDISQKDLLDETKSYGGGSGDLSSDNPDGQIFTEAIFESSGVVLLTNNLVEKPIVYDRYYLHSKLAYAMADTSSKIVLDTTAIESAQLNAPEFHLNKGPTSEPLVIRSFFPETWIWENATADSSGRFSLKRKAPDTITSWLVSAFSIDEQTGFGLSGGRTSVRVFRPFFIKLNLPYSIIRGETVNIQAVIFNYSKRPSQAKVTLDNSKGEFEFVGAANSIGDETYSSETSESKLIRVPAEDGVSVSFLITPKKLGHIDIKMLAQAEFASDAVIRKLLVKPEGQTQHVNRALLVRLPDEATGAGSLDRNISIDIPANAVPGSRKVFVSAVGDLMGPGLSNVDDLLRLPYGCGEQNMINLVPNIVILNYLQNTGRLRESQRSRAVRNIEAGYQRELNYRRNDGSFSAFGNSDTNGSVWLTAYVLKTLKQAKRFTSIDEQVLSRAANFIASLSKADGSIREVGMLHHKALASSSNDGGSSVYLTAYSMLALMQQPRTSPGTGYHYGAGPFPMVPLDEVLERGLAYLESRLDEAAAKENPYDLAIIAYALQLANRSGTKDKAYEQLWLKAQQQADLIWWQPGKSSAGADSADEPAAAPKPDASGRLIDLEDAELLPASSSSTTSRPPPLKPILVSGKQSEHQFVPDSLAIEMTALALLTAIARGGPELDRAFPIVSWLISKQNSNGGYASTQDTVLAIEALAAFAEANSAARSTNNAAMDVDLLYPRANKRPDSIRKNSVDQLLINKANALVNQQLRLPDNVTWVQLQASGSGLAVIQVAWQYNLAVSAERPAFYLNPILDKSSSVNYLQLSVCTFYKAGDSSNMAVMEVELPSGYTADLEALAGLRRSSEVKRVDTADGDTKIIIYLDRVTRDELCLTIPAHRSSKVSNNKPTPVSIYDYYNRQKAARIFYEPPAASSCDICDSDECSARCSAAKAKPSDRLISLHEQRKQAESNSAPPPPPDRFANLTLPNNGAGSDPRRRYTTDDYERLLPLAPVLMKLKAAARGLY